MEMVEREKEVTYKNLSEEIKSLKQVNEGLKQEGLGQRKKLEDY